MVCMLFPWQQGDRNTETQKGCSGILEIQSGSISLSGAMIILPDGLNEKHFGGRVCGFSHYGGTVSIWLLLKQVNLNQEGQGMHLSDLKLTSSFPFFIFMAGYDTQK